jgi:hypothetical protein
MPISYLLLIAWSNYYFICPFEKAEAPNQNEELTFLKQNRVKAGQKLSTSTKHVWRKSKLNENVYMKK